MPKGQIVECLSAPGRIPEEAENLPLDPCVGVTPDAESSSGPEPQPDLAPVQNAELTPVLDVEPAPVCRSQ